MKTPVATTEDGVCFALAPDVCFLPAPPPPAGPGGIPTPYPNQGSCNDAKDVTEKVLIRNKPVLVGGSYIPSTHGDEAGASPQPGRGHGLQSGSTGDKCEFAGQSSVVKFEGKGVVCLGETTKHNKSNTMGKHSVPSQTTVIAAK